MTTKIFGIRTALFLCTVLIPLSAWAVEFEGSAENEIAAPEANFVRPSVGALGENLEPAMNLDGVTTPQAMPSYEASEETQEPGWPDQSGLDGQSLMRLADIVRGLPNQSASRKGDDETPYALALHSVGQQKFELLEIARGPAVVWVDLTHMAIDPDNDQTGEASGMTPAQAAAFVNAQAAEWLKILEETPGSAATESAAQQPTKSLHPSNLPKDPKRVFFDGEESPNAGGDSVEVPEAGSGQVGDSQMPSWMEEAAGDILKNGAAAVHKLTAEQKGSLVERLGSDLEKIKSGEAKQQIFDLLKAKLDLAVQTGRMSQQDMDGRLAKLGEMFDADMETLRSATQAVLDAIAGASDSSAVSDSGNAPGSKVREVGPLMRNRLNSTFGEIQRNRFSGIQWSNEMPNGIGFVRVSVFGFGSIKYDAMIAVGNLDGESAVSDPNEAAQFIFVWSDGKTTRYSQSLPIGPAGGSGPRGY
jgi:hypothetical protein